MTIESLVEFLGWCTILNYALLIFSTLMLATKSGDWAKGIHSKLFKIPQENLDALYFSYLANYKLAIFIFNLVPYIVLKIMG
ncbi:MAG: hypothetical protein KJP25_03845 [Gammaproteobacteria bacterium]|nr:hypothetical protein [Gammaproteobacteria bacterium]NND38962.1 hypothetical protein [Pseudomonadales bacterium]MBT8151920.1 hypothetical protein [Gammaproteobacteria bacterium]NNL11230.1 hypothetical protein [Pseudomonadales bacterium]NNM10974.1 hypothetical protein [Pseudomonadales bacterium]